MPRIYLGTGPARAAADDRKVSVDIAHPSARALLAELEEVVARAQFEIAAGHPFWAPVPVELVVRASS
jgi:hypothetical protein